MVNRKMIINGAGSKYIGVYWSKDRQKWVVRIQSNNIRKYIGSFNIEKEAATAYNNAATICHGKFAILNKI